MHMETAAKYAFVSDGAKKAQERNRQRVRDREKIRVQMLEAFANN